MKMYDTKRMAVYAFMFISGMVLVILSVFEIVPADTALSGVGGGLAGISAVRIFLGMKYRKNEEYARQIDIANTDERTVFISNKAKLWSFYLTVIICAVVGIGLILSGLKAYGMICCTVVCGMCFIYFVAYIILNRRY